MKTGTVTSQQIADSRGMRLDADYHVDPLGKEDKEETGNIREEIGNIKQGAGKRQWSLLPFDALRPVVDVFKHGADKYEPDNWMKQGVATPKRYFDAVMRHILAWRDGEDVDKESGHSHLAHAMCCLLIIMWHEMRGSDG
jgi:hypothetical protein